MSRTRAAFALCGLALVLGLGACVPHPVGPARTFAKYEGKATTTAEGALSAVETVRLAAETAGRDHAFGPYLSVLTSEQEESATGVQGTFDSIQPPNDKADQLKDELDELLSNVVDHIGQVRVAIRRGRIDDLPDVAKDLEDDSQKLNDFIEGHSK